jgi:hypothetical protein
MVKIICLANSKKNGDRCIAGIDICTEKWIRPVSKLQDGKIPVNRSLVNGKEPQLLDILDIPLVVAGVNKVTINLDVEKPKEADAQTSSQITRVRESRTRRTRKNPGSS